MKQPGIQFLRVRPQWCLSAVVLALFLLAQTAALIHAETHGLHDNSSLCAAFQAVEHQPALGGADLAVVGPVFFGTDILAAKPPQFYGGLQRVFLARGPPSGSKTFTA